jgi:hypothetical protein
MYVNLHSLRPGQESNLGLPDCSGDVGVDEKIILEWILGKEGGKVWTECT